MSQVLFGIFFPSPVFSECEKPGLSESDLKTSVENLRLICERLGAKCALLRYRDEEDGKVQEYLVRKEAGDDDFMEVRYVLDTLHHYCYYCKCVGRLVKLGKG